MLKMKGTTRGALAGLAVPGRAAAAQGLPKLVDEVKIQKSADSPGQVVFHHAAHVGMQARPSCTACHPKAFPILKSSAARRPPITHASMDKGGQCGACHDGKKAFSLQDDCTNCHTQ
jgi:c(7)-type cytochrome triheme protein